MAIHTLDYIAKLASKQQLPWIGVYMLQAPICIISLDPQNNSVNTYSYFLFANKETLDSEKLGHKVTQPGSSQLRIWVKVCMFPKSLTTKVGSSWKKKIKESAFTVVIVVASMESGDEMSLGDHLTWQMHLRGQQPHSMFLWIVVRFLRYKKTECVLTAPPTAQEEYQRNRFLVPFKKMENSYYLPVAEDWNLSHDVRFY